jgi:mitogen-activated protein kinase binding protein 1
MSSSKAGHERPMRLERVLGITTQSNASLSSSKNGDIFYSAGCVAVRYNAEENRQKSFSQGSNRSISCQAVSDCGNFLAIGERGHQPTITVWEIHTNQKIVTLSGHKHGIGCLGFSPDGKFLVSAGFRHDKQLLCWDWASMKLVSTLKVTHKVHAVRFHPSGDFFVTCGDRHMKWWTLHYDDGGVMCEITGKAASIMEEHSSAVFLDVCCGTGAYDSYVFSCSATGLLCTFSTTGRMMETWIQMESPSAYCLSLLTRPDGYTLLFAGCADGVIRAFQPHDLQYLATLPLPSPLSPNSLDLTYPACYALCSIQGNALSPVPKLAAIYADHSLFIWDVSDVYRAAKYRSFLYHFGCVWDIHFVEGFSGNSSSHSSSDSTPAVDKDGLPASATLPWGTFITCSSDNFIRVWNVDPQAQRKSKWKNIYSKDMLHAIEVNSDDAHLEYAPGVGQSVSSTASTSSAMSSVTGITGVSGHSKPSVDLSTDIPDYELPNKLNSVTTPRSLAIHPNGRHCACGDKAGRLRVYDLLAMVEVLNTQAHAAEILTLQYSPPMQPTSTDVWTTDVDNMYPDPPMVLLATAGRDRLVHVFDASAGYKAVKTLDNHSSSVTCVKFTNDGQCLLSCGGDRTMVFSSVKGPAISRLKSVQTPHGTINGLAVEPTNKFAVTSGQDKRLNIWSMQNGKHVRAYKSPMGTGELYKCDIDPSGKFAAHAFF